MMSAFTNRLSASEGKYFRIRSIAGGFLTYFKVKLVSTEIPRFGTLCSQQHQQLQTAFLEGSFLANRDVKVTVQFERCFRLREHISVIS